MEESLGSIEVTTTTQILFEKGHMLWQSNGFNLRQYFSDSETEDVDPAYESSDWYKRQESSKPDVITLPVATHTGFLCITTATATHCKCSYSSCQCCHYSESKRREVRLLYCQPLSCKATCQAGASHEITKPHWLEIHSYLSGKGVHSTIVGWWSDGISRGAGHLTVPGC